MLQMSPRAAAGAAILLCSLAPRVAADPASDLASALAQYPALSNLRSLVNQNPTLVNSIVGNSKNLTVLAPSNEAFSGYATAHDGQALGNATTEFITNTLSYHILAGGLRYDSISESGLGLTVPTLLTGELYNNRSAGPSLAAAFGPGANGQVVYVTKSSDGFLQIQASQEHVNLTALDKSWSGGVVQLVDKIFDLPKNCTSTMEEEPQLNTLYNLLEDSGAYDSIDTMANVTCLGPNNAAFTSAGNPQASFNSSQLQWMVRSHVISQALYPDQLTTGVVLQSLRNTSIEIRTEGNSIYFNNAKVQSTSLTNNGVIYVLDRVLDISPTTTASAPSGSSTNAGFRTAAVSKLGVAAVAGGALAISQLL